jgi:RimJ/RimL family protein N-acetyltransferase
VIETERLLLRVPEAGDAAAIVHYLGDPQVMRWIGRDGEAGSFDDAVARIERWRHAWELDGFGHFVVERREDGEVIGQNGLLAWDPDTWQNGTRTEIGDTAEIEIGWTIERSAWGRGYATEAATAVRDWAFREVRPRRLISLIHPDNEPSRRVAQKIGEQHERDVVMHHGGPAQLWALVHPR